MQWNTSGMTTDSQALLQFPKGYTLKMKARPCAATEWGGKLPELFASLPHWLVAIVLGFRKVTSLLHYWWLLMFEHQKTNILSYQIWFKSVEFDAFQKNENSLEKPSLPSCSRVLFWIQMLNFSHIASGGGKYQHIKTQVAFSFPVLLLPSHLVNLHIA